MRTFQKEFFKTQVSLMIWLKWLDNPEWAQGEIPLEEVQLKVQLACIQPSFLCLPTNWASLSKLAFSWSPFPYQ